MSEIERVARALRDEIGRQWNAHPIPGDANPDSWTATGGVLDLEVCVRAILIAIRTPSEAIVEAGAADRFDSRFQSYADAISLAFTAMIDKLLEEP